MSLKICKLVHVIPTSSIKALKNHRVVRGAKVKLYGVSVSLLSIVCADKKRSVGRRNTFVLEWSKGSIGGGEHFRSQSSVRRPRSYSRPDTERGRGWDLAPGQPRRTAEKLNTTCAPVSPASSSHRSAHEKRNRTFRTLHTLDRH